MTAEAGPTPKPRKVTVRRPRDMAISLAVLLVPLGLIFFGWSFLTGGQDVSPQDLRPSYESASRAGLDIVKPKGLSEDWVPISQVVDDGKDDVTMRIGFVTPSDAGIQLVESDSDPKALLSEELGKRPKQTGQEDRAGREWQVYKTIEGKNAFVASGEDLSIVVQGDAEVAELRDFVDALD